MCTLPPETFHDETASERPGPGGSVGVSREGAASGAKLVTQSPMDVVGLPNTEPMRCPRGDMATDSVSEVWLSL